MKYIISGILLLGVVYFVGMKTPENWNGFFYPDRDNLNSYTVSPAFSDLSDCHDWIDKETEGKSGFDFECGEDCHYNGDLYICKETVK